MEIIEKIFNYVRFGFIFNFINTGLEERESTSTDLYLICFIFIDLPAILELGKIWKYWKFL